MSLDARRPDSQGPDAVRLSALAPFPAVKDLPDGYERTDPTDAAVGRAMDRLLSGTDWAALCWPDLVDALMSLGRSDIGLSRLTEGHVDAVRILAQAKVTPAEGRYGVWASRSHATGLTAAPDGDGWRLDGTLRFASGAGLLDRALVPVWTSPEEHLLLDLPVRHWPVDDTAWATSAMRVSRSHTVHVDRVHAGRERLVGPPGFYLGRPGFFPGGVGVAAVWAGGAARIADLVGAYVAPAPPLAARSIRLGHLRTDCAVAGALVQAAAGRLDALGGLDGLGGLDSQGGLDSLDDQATVSVLRRLATETRAGVAAAVMRVLGQARRIAGPAGLAFAADLTGAIADLDLYVRQQNPDADAEYLGDVQA